MIDNVMSTPKKALTSKTEKQIRAQLTKIERTKTQIADLRDVLREQLSDLEGIMESLDTGIADIEAGKRQIEDGLAEISKYL